ncbi:hypothetical protein LY76DRAFT_259524 [Colletotrichum caudatum]|nr:hypothetical protein LY76DRAFT_259524 [Colletotrichum caudatum]
MYKEKKEKNPYDIKQAMIDKVQGLSTSGPNLVQGIGARNRTRHFTHTGSKRTKAQVEKRRCNFLRQTEVDKNFFPPVPPHVPRVISNCDAEENALKTKNLAGSRVARPYNESKKTKCCRPPNPPWGIPATHLTCPLFAERSNHFCCCTFLCRGRISPS